MNAHETLLSFLYELNPDIVYVEDTVEELVEANFDTLDEKNMRLLIDAALKERDLNLKKGGNENELLGSWGVVIDLIKTTTLKRRNRAGDMLQLVVNTGVKSGPKELQSLLATLKAEKKIDRVFTDLIATSLEDCQAQGNDVLVDILKYTKTFIGVLASKEKFCKPTTGTAPPPPPASSVSASSTEKSPTTPTVASTSSQSTDAIAAAELEGEMVRAGALLREMLTESAGDVTALRTNAIERCLTGEIDTPFLAVLEDNIKGCRDANYVNKLKVLEFLKTAVSSQLDQQKLSANANISDRSGQSTTTHHAPQFVDDVATSSNGRGSKRSFTEAEHVEVTLMPEVEGHFIDAVEASAALRGTSASVTHPGKVNNKKKAAKSSAKKQVTRMAEAAAVHLEEHGWAVLDNFLPEELVQRVRVESGLFRNSYEQSEIWVGKQSDVGAQLSVPSVRGDKVLWMCGGHSSAAPEGVSRTVRTIGEIEPCKLEVKAQAPIRKFGAMKELVGSADALMEAMKAHSPSLTGVYERSDAMLAVYPGEGARFAKHIDNSTGDGRKLTLLAYLNPHWKKEDGGALRLFPKPHPNAESPDQQHQAVDVYPIGGRVAMFYSADVAHEVLPTFGDRHAITLWYYDQAERADAVKRAREEGSAKKVATASAASQQTAKVFISELMGGDDVTEDGGQPTESELQALARKVTQLSDEVVGVVAAITGAPSAQSFRTGFPMLSTQDLKSMRALFRRMGLGSYAVANY